MKERQLAEINRQRSAYLRGRTPLSPQGRCAIVVDDGVATGSTAIVAIKVSMLYIILFS
jgi:putative phosphoribosyl transferase